MASELTNRTYRAAHGRWREILSTLGVPADALNGKCQPCPLCGGTDRFQFTDRGGEGEYICRQCGAGKGMLLLMKHTGWEFRQAAVAVDQIIGNLPATKPARTGGTVSASIFDLRRLWESGVAPCKNTLIDLYLRSRGITVQSFPKALRLVPALRHGPSRQIMPCMIAQFFDADGKPKQIHRTYLTETGTKAEVEPVRMFMPGPLPKGGSIMLGLPQETMGVAEGVETALSAALIHGMPVWATTSASMLKEWMPPQNAKRILVFGDNDANHVGQIAAHELARRLVNDGFKVDVKFPPTEGTDWNDVLRGRDERQPE